MAENQYINKVVYGNTALIDLTNDQVTVSDLLLGVTAHDRSGAPITGSCTYDSDTTDANAVANDILTGKSGYVNGQKGDRACGERQRRGFRRQSAADQSHRHHSRRLQRLRHLIDQKTERRGLAPSYFQRQEVTINGKC